MVVEHVARRHSTVLEGGFGGVADHSHDTLTALVEAGQQHAADRVLAAEELRRQCLVDDDDAVAAFAIAGIEATAAADGYFHRREVLACHHAECGGVAGDIGAPLDSQAPVVAGASQRQLLRGAHRGHPRQRLELRQHVGDHATAFSRCQSQRHRGVDDDGAVDVDARIDGAEVGDAADEEARACGEDHGERHLHHDEPPFETAAPTGYASGAGCCHRRLQAAAAPQRHAGNDRDQERRRQRRKHRGPEHGPVEARVFRERAQWQRADEHVKSHHREPRANDAGDHANDDRLEHELLHEALAVGAERRAHGELRRAGVDLTEHQRSDVGTGDQQDDAHRRQCCDKAWPHVTHEEVARALHRWVLPLVPLRAGILELRVEHAGERFEMGAHPIERFPVGHAADEGVEPGPALRSHLCGRPDPRQRAGEPEPTRHHADDRAGQSAELQPLADDCGIGSEFLPKRVAENDHELAADGVFPGAEGTAECRLGTEHVEELRRHGHAWHQPHGRARHFERQVVGPIGAHPLKPWKLPAQAEDLLLGPRAVEVHDADLVFPHDRQRIDQQGAHDAEDGSSAAGAERQREHCQ